MAIQVERLFSSAVVSFLVGNRKTFLFSLLIYFNSHCNFT